MSLVLMSFYLFFFYNDALIIMHIKYIEKYLSVDKAMLKD